MGPHMANGHPGGGHAGGGHGSGASDDGRGEMGAGWYTGGPGGAYTSGTRGGGGVNGGQQGEECVAYTGGGQATGGGHAGPANTAAATITRTSAARAPALDAVLPLMRHLLTENSSTPGPSTGKRQPYQFSCDRLCRTLVYNSDFVKRESTRAVTIDLQPGEKFHSLPPTLR
jgi:hypothetical protein